MLSEDITPAAFGAAGDGHTDDTKALQKAIDAAAAGNRRIRLDGGAYATTGIIISADGLTIEGPGRIQGAGDEPAIHVRGQADDRPVRGVTLRGIRIGATARRATVLLNNASDCLFEDCHVTVCREWSQGIRLEHGCAHNTIRRCRVEATYPTEPVSLVGVCLVADIAGGGHAGFFTPPDGRIVYIDQTVRENVLEANEISGGTHGVLICGASHTRITRNTIRNNSHRNINISPAGRHTLIEDNTLLDAGSSAVAMAYGATHNVIRNNQARSYVTGPGGDRDAIHAYVSSASNTIVDNSIEGDFRYGVYLAVNAQDNHVHGNRIELHPKADLPGDFSVGIGIENDWLARPLPPQARYSRQNYGPPTILTWGRADTTGNRITGNDIRAATCGIYMAQIGDVCRTRGNTVTDNAIGPAVGEPVYRLGDAD